MTEPAQEIDKSHCDNCGEVLQGDFCHACGQSVQSTKRFFGTIFMELLDNLFSYDSRVYRTLVPLIFKPGFVCSEYLAGKRASFLPPFRLYLFASVVFFLLVPYVNDISMSLELSDEEREVVSKLEDEAADYISHNLSDKEREAISKLEDKAAGYIRLNKDDRSVDVVGIRPGEADNVDDDFPWFVEERRLMREKLFSFGEQDADALLETSLNTLPTVMFFLLPLLALALKCLYFFQRRYYMEHLIVVLYSQSFVFFMLLIANSVEHAHDILGDRYAGATIILTLGNFLLNVCYAWIPLHLFLFMKRVYAQPFGITLFKYSLMSFVYFGLITMAVTTTVVWGVFKV